MNKVMKGNKAPEKIYLLQDDRNSNGLSICWYEAPYSTGAIEYTRTDAFIEKTCEFIETYPHLFMGILRSEVIEDFKKKYMKG